MPELSGVITDLIRNPRKDNEVFGIRVAGAEYVWSFPEYRGEPFEDSNLAAGTFVRLEYEEREKAGKTKRYVSVLECPAGAQAGSPLQDAPVQVTEWGYRQRDILMFIESCAKGACGIYGAALEGRQIEEMPKTGEITALARSIEEHGVARFKALMENL